MKAIFFVEIEGIRFYKTDTFWSKSKDFTNAKVHTDSEDDKRRFFAPLIERLKPYKKFEHSDDEFDKIKKWIGALYGYQKVIKEVSDGWTLSKDSELSDPVYLRIIDSVNKFGDVDSSDAKIVIRNRLINDIFNEKD